MDESILISIKKMLGIEEDDDSFDTDILIHINTAISILKQLGVGVSSFCVNDDSEVWSDFIGTNLDLVSVKTYIFLKVRMVFDPSASATISSAMSETIRELEWRLNVLSDDE